LALRSDPTFNDVEVIRQDSSISESIPTFIHDPSSDLPISLLQSPIATFTSIPSDFVNVFAVEAAPLESPFEAITEASSRSKDLDFPCRPDYIPISPNQVALVHRRSRSKSQHIFTPSKLSIDPTHRQPSSSDFDITPSSNLFGTTSSQIGNSSLSIAHLYPSTIDFFFIRDILNKVFHFVSTPSPSCSTFVSTTHFSPRTAIRGRPPRQRLKIPQLDFIY
jgi:hypothetical protein